MQWCHGYATRQAEILWVVIQTNNWLMDGEVDRMEGYTTTIVRPNREHCTCHVNGWCSADDTAVETQS